MRNFNAVKRGEDVKLHINGKLDEIDYEESIDKYYFVDNNYPPGCTAI